MDKRVLVRAVKHDDIDVRALARALILLAQEQSKADDASVLEEVAS